MRIKPPHPAAGIATGVAICTACTIRLYNNPWPPLHPGLYHYGWLLGAITITAFVTGWVGTYNTRRLLSTVITAHEEHVDALIAAHEEHVDLLLKEADERCDALVNATIDAVRQPGATVENIQRMLTNSSMVQKRHVQLSKDALAATLGLVAATPARDIPEITGEHPVTAA